MTARSRPAPFGLRALNRATLARQMLLAREKATVLGVIERLVALQAQWPKPPFVGVWTRAQQFRREDLTGLLLARKVVRATSLRGTIHVMTAKDFLGLRSAIQPALTQGALTIMKARAKAIDVAALLKRARPFFATPRSFEELRDHFLKEDPRADERAMAYMVRLHLPLVQVPTDAPWGFPAASSFVDAELWLGKRITGGGAEALALRYLAAFGPATAGDLQTWSGLPAPLARETFEALRPKLTVLSGERGRELFDLPDAPRPDADVLAPPRFLPEFDNLVLSHVDRTRFLADAHRKSVYLPGLRVAPTFLVDGFVAGTWKVERARSAATLELQPFAALSKDVRAALEQEGAALLRFLESDARTFDLRFAKP
jgi:hypothetical protein